MDNDLKDIAQAMLDKTAEMTKDTAGALAKMQTNMDSMETEMKKNSIKTPTTVRGTIRAALKEVREDLIKNGKKDVNLNLNAILQPTNFVAGDAPVVLPFREAGVDKTTYAPTLLSDIIQWGTTSSNMVDWIERTAKTDAAAMRAEGATMMEGDLTYTEVSTKVKSLSEFMKATNESLKDVDFLASEINSELLDDLKNLLEIQLMSGDGTGNNLLGILPQATASVMTGFTGTVHEANEADVLRVALNQIYIAGNGSYTPNHILMHPTDVTKLDLLKIADGRYIDVPFYNADTLVLARVPIMQSTRVAVGSYVVGDFNRAKGFIRDPLAIRIWDQNEDDVLFNRSTITGNMRLAFRIKNTDKAAFVKGVFATDMALLETA